MQTKMTNYNKSQLDKIYKEIKNFDIKKDDNSGVELLYEGLDYYFTSKGKMLRPALMLSVNEDLGGDFQAIENFAIALELIHNYSLIHDDLPSMDNDDYRRGRLTLHKKFDEATAILIGDHLLTKAFEYASYPNNFVEASLQIKCINLLAQNANDFGMLGGQILDMNPSNLSSEEDILKMYEYKTSALFKSAFVIPGIIKNLEDVMLDSLDKVGKNFGILFQILDDISDREEDKKTGKITIFNFYDETEVEKYVEKLKSKIYNELDFLKLNTTRKFLKELYG